jgi:hypothetical protein
MLAILADLGLLSSAWDCFCAYLALAFLLHVRSERFFRTSCFLATWLTASLLILCITRNAGKAGPTWTEAILVVFFFWVAVYLLAMLAGAPVAFVRALLAREPGAIPPPHTPGPTRE